MSVNDFKFIPIELPALRCLTLNAFDIPILEHFLGARNLVEVSLGFYHGIESYSENNVNILVQFLGQQMALKNLKVHFAMHEFLFSADHSFQFQLTSLDIDLDDEDVRKSY